MFRIVLASCGIRFLSGAVCFISTKVMPQRSVFTLSFPQNVENLHKTLINNEIFFFHNFGRCGKLCVENFLDYNQIHEIALALPRISN
jgi:hypothetical protein